MSDVHEYRGWKIVIRKNENGKFLYDRFLPSGTKWGCLKTFPSEAECIKDAVREIDDLDGGQT